MNYLNIFINNNNNNNKNKLKIYIIGWYHHKNHDFLKYFCERNFCIVSNIIFADIVLSGDTYIQIEQYPNKKFIFGPHFSVFPNEITNKFNNIYNNAIYIQPSEQCIDMWQNYLNYTKLPMKSIPFGVNTEKFKLLTTNRNKIFIYYKRRKPEEFKYIISFLKKNNISYEIFDYINKYNEIDYINYLHESKYGIWLGSHESQGFALEEALSCNVPLLVWNVTNLSQEYGNNFDKNIKATTIPYWDERCGEYFYEENEFENAYNKFINNLDKYNPREYILENLSYEVCDQKWMDLINNL